MFGRFDEVSFAARVWRFGKEDECNMRDCFEEPRNWELEEIALEFFFDQAPWSTSDVQVEIPLCLSLGVRLLRWEGAGWVYVVVKVG